MAFRTLTVAAILCGWACQADAQPSVRLEFTEGRITLSARNAPLRAILAEWARLGGTTIVNGDGVAGPPVTLELTGVPERQALDVVLRGVSGYMIAPRRADSSGASMFDRILILPTSTAPRPPPPATVARPTPQRPPVLARPPQPEVAPDEDSQDAAEQASEQEPAAAGQLPRPGDPRVRPPILQTSPVIAESDDGEQPNDDVPPSVKPTAANPFGIPAGSSATPGTVTPVPQGPQRQGPGRVQ